MTENVAGVTERVDEPPRRRIAGADNREARREELITTGEYRVEEPGFAFRAVLLGVHALSMLAGVLEYKSIEGYPGAVHALDEATRLGALGGARARGRMVPCRPPAHRCATVRTRSKGGATGRAMQAEAGGVSEDHTWRKPPRERRNEAGQAQAHAQMEFECTSRQAKRGTRRNSSQRRRRRADE